MSEELKNVMFKAMTHDHKKWVFGYYVGVGQMLFKTPQMVLPDKRDLTMVAIDPDTLCVYTGFCDTKYIPIYTNDILEYEDEDGNVVRVKVLFEDGAICTCEKDCVADYMDSTFIDLTKPKVVGNMLNLVESERW